MAAKTREIKGRMKAVGNIERITRTMQMIATAQFQNMHKRAADARPYTQKIAEVVGELTQALGSEGQISHPLLSPPRESAGRELLLVLTSTRGLCGAYNANILRTVSKHMEADDTERDIEVVGKKGMGYFRFNQIEVTHFHDHITDKPQWHQVEELAERYMDDYKAGRYDAVRVASMHFESMSIQRPRVIRLLPMEPPSAAGEAEASGNESTAEGQESESGPPSGAGGGSTPLYEFSPEPATLLSELLPITVKTRLFQCFNEAVVSEHLARMVAMQSATDAANKMKNRLNREFNRARQAQITKELSEIIGGAEAVE
jgi:F-type H+-transporting ATPase subunit gamma